MARKKFEIALSLEVINLVNFSNLVLVNTNWVLILRALWTECYALIHRYLLKKVIE